MGRALLVTFTVLALFSACTQRMTCPAFQSAYIYDKDELRKKFSYFQEDSTPKVLTASKNRFLIAEPVTYRKKIRTMSTLAMKPVNPVLPDSMRISEDAMMGEDGVVPGAELDLAARSVIDSIYIIDVPRDTLEQAEDSVYVISKDKEIRVLKYNFPDSLIYDPNTGKYVRKTPKYTVAEVTFNVDQDNYMWYLRDYLVLPDVRLARLKQSESKEVEKSKKKKEKKGFFRNLFKKKQKEQADTSDIKKPARQEEEFDYVDEDEQLQEQQDQTQKPPKEKKGLFSRKKKDSGKTSNGGDGEPEKPVKKKKEKKPKQSKKKEEPAEEEKDEDDGF
jgi:hypothetical protein